LDSIAKARIRPAECPQSDVNISSFSGVLDRVLYEVTFRTRGIGANPDIAAFSRERQDAISRIYVINLDRESTRWRHVSQELGRFRGRMGVTLASLTRRFPAVDARYLPGRPRGEELDPSYSLADQLFVEGTPQLGADVGAQDWRIDMTPQEVAIALSHIAVWRLIAASRSPYSLVLEDDIYFRRGFAQNINKVWAACLDRRTRIGPIDMLYLSFKKAGGGLATESCEDLLRVPDRGLWQMSGYVLSGSGAQKLLDLLPARGPIDLWLNLQFERLHVVTTRRPIISQRRGIPSTNSYSVLPVLSKAGFLTREERLVFRERPLPSPIIAFGDAGSGLTALATGLSMLGYRCCNDLSDVPTLERAHLLENRRTRVFGAYVNIGSLGSDEITEVARLYPRARFIITTLDAVADSPSAVARGGEPEERSVPEGNEGSRALMDSVTQRAPGRVLLLPAEHQDKWQILTDFLGCEYPAFPYPSRAEIGQRQLEAPSAPSELAERLQRRLRFDKSPWIIPSARWRGIPVTDVNERPETSPRPACVWRGRSIEDDDLWSLRDDTFPSNLALFRPQNVSVGSDAGAQLTLRQEKTSVRDFTSGAIASKAAFLYGTFEAELRPSDAAGVVTGVFLHRNGPRQEIDIEFLGKDTSTLMANVYFNPGNDGTRLEFGYRGTPTVIHLGFDASKAFHRYTIDWRSHFIRWYVDGRLVHERVTWEPTPIPDMPLQFNVNLWPSRSKALAGTLDVGRLPAHTDIRTLQAVALP
jgi:GR25 family glycosyltransferase involved in LPS biosynthesis